MKTGHVLSGVLAGLLTEGLVLPGGAPLERGVFVTVCAVGALVPDLDAPGATLSKALPPVTWAASLLLCWLSAVAYTTTRTELDPASKGVHRTLTHTAVFAPAAGIVCAIPVSIWADPRWALVVGVSMTIGCWAHIAGDCCTETGCPVWWPVKMYGKRWKYVGIPKILRFKTGKTVEKVAVTPLLVLAVTGVAGINLGVWEFVGQIAGGME